MEKYPPVLTVAQYLCSLVSEEEGDVVTNLKIQKLLYLAQGLSLALVDDRLFKEDIIMSNTGPVIEKVFNHFENFGNASLSKPSLRTSFSLLSDHQKSMIEEVYDIYGIYSSSRLGELIREGDPWKMTEVNSAPSDRVMRRYFQKIVAILQSEEGLFVKPPKQRRSPPAAIRRSRK